VLKAFSRQPIRKTKWHVPINYRLAELYQMHEQWRSAVKHYSAVAKAKTKSKLKAQSIKRLREIKAYLKQLKAAEQSKIEAAKEAKKKKAANQ